MSVQKSWSELQKMHRACTIVVDTLEALAQAAAPGVTTRELDRIAREHIVKAGAKPAFLGYRGYPATLCISVNEEVVHGIPGSRRLQDGDIVSLDLGCVVDGFYGDSARTVAVGNVSPEAKRLMRVTEEALHEGIAVCHPGRRVGDIGHAVQQHAEKNGYSVVKDFVGHGIGTSLHEEPQVPNYGPPGRLQRLVPGMCLAIEPMVNLGGAGVRVLDDGWTAVTADGKLSAHFELSVAVTEAGPWILSEPYPYAGTRAHA
ncbi:MAG TPA: type I methionyl aminopeptidase [Vicinamibacteria bacterium]|nr:type I methionyl aminopeptidase [Vicinamibacteria bacterium]